MFNESENKYSGPARHTSIVLCLACGFLMFCILMVDLSMPLGVAGGVPYIAVVLISLWSHQKKFTVLVSIICSVLTILGFFYSPAGGEMWKVVCNRVLALFAIWVTATLTLQRETIEKQREKAVLEREKALEDIKILRGLLPICASCKKIRDEKGNWSIIESYIHRHSEAQFSHSICPECQKKLYPELYGDEKQSNQCKKLPKFAKPT